jgi:uncharacterized protein (DUF1330 family)
MLRRMFAIAMVASIALGAILVDALHAQSKPPVYLVFDAKIKDPQHYGPFAKMAGREIKAEGGTFIVAGAKPEFLVGNKAGLHIFSISRWSDKEAIRHWFNSKPMKAVREAQKKYTTTRLYIVEGPKPK